MANDSENEGSFVGSLRFAGGALGGQGGHGQGKKRADWRTPKGFPPFPPNKIRTEISGVFFFRIGRLSSPERRPGSWCFFSCSRWGARFHWTVWPVSSRHRTIKRVSQSTLPTWVGTEREEERKRKEREGSNDGGGGRGPFPTDETSCHVCRGWGWVSLVCSFTESRQVTYRLAVVVDGGSGRRRRLLSHTHPIARLEHRRGAEPSV